MKENGELNGSDGKTKTSHGEKFDMKVSMREGSKGRSNEE